MPGLQLVPFQGRTVPSSTADASDAQRARGGVQTGPEAPLGTNAEKRATFLSDFLAPPEEMAKLARAERYELQELVRSLFPDDLRIRGCLVFPYSNSQTVDIRRSHETRLAYYSGLQTCGRGAVCPRCGSKIAEHRCGEIQRALDVWRGRGHHAALMTFTMPHYRSQRLSDNLAALLEAYRQLTRNGPYRRLYAAAGLRHTIRALEIPWSRLNGYHPHLHILAFFDRDFSAPDFSRVLSRLWLANLKAQGVQMKSEADVLAHGVRVDARSSAGGKYLTKVGRSWGLAEEVSKANRKRGRGESYTPVDLLRHLRDGTLPEAAAVFREYAEASRDCHFLRWSRGMRDDLALAGEQTDEEIAAGFDQADPYLARLDARAWRAVRRAGWRARLRLVELAEQDEESADAYLAHLLGGYVAAGGVA